MSAEISKRIAEFLDSGIEEDDVGQPYFGNPDYELLPFPPASFVPIKDVEPNIRTAFVDGGNQEILGAPNFSAQINRVYFNIFKGRDRILPKSLPRKIEFYSATMSDFRNGEIFYDTRVFPLKIEFEGLIPKIGTCRSVPLTEQSRLEIRGQTYSMLLLSRGDLLSGNLPSMLLKVSLRRGI